MDAVLRDIPHTRLAARGGGKARNIRAGKQNRAARGIPQPEQRFQQFLLAVAVDARNADDFSRADAEARVFHHKERAVFDKQVRYVQNASAGTTGGAAEFGGERFANHQAHGFLCVERAGFAGKDGLAVAEHGDFVGDC
ncbi:hypothetical protein SDC9_104572 [bioreactor metagenome]|uniref:Uncharacterized protein n=1 Tax=bioreactor metagenome TaxID=1076179 RepID=A0A645AXC7_9ZZZZ